MKSYSVYDLTCLSLHKNRILLFKIFITALVKGFSYHKTENGRKKTVQNSNRRSKSAALPPIKKTCVQWNILFHET